MRTKLRQTWDIGLSNLRQANQGKASIECAATHTNKSSSPLWLRWAARLSIAAAGTGFALAAEETRPIDFTASAAVKEALDSNVHLQSATDKANQDSMVTTIMPNAGMNWRPSSNFDLTLGYAPEFSFFHAEPSEDFVLHRGIFNAAAQAGATTLEWANTAVKIDGSSEGPTWTGPGGPAAAGGLAVRDRRDALVLRHLLRSTIIVRNWILRPLVTGYIHDFQTAHRATPGYQNYADRNEVAIGADVGRPLQPGLNGFLGYRWGHQDQARVLNYAEEYDSAFHRFLFGLEGKAVSWMKLNISAGPELRSYDNSAPDTFGGRDEINFYVDATATLSLGKADTIAASVKQFEQPGFGGRSAYEDLTCDLTWRHNFGDRLTVGAGFRAYNTDFLDPVKRNDWIYGTSALLNCSFAKDLNGEVSYLFEQGDSRIPHLEGREYDRHVLALGLKYKFK